MSNASPPSRPRRKDNTVLYVVLGLSGVLLASCICVCCGVGGYFLVVKGPFAALGNADLSEANLAKISNGMSTGMTLREVEGIIGKGSVASPSEISFVNGRLSKFNNAQVPPAAPGKTKYVWKSRGAPNTTWLFLDVDNSTRRIGSMTTYSGPN